ncbi:cadherin-like domain-containing protein [Vibrio scophthalmi]|uniref:Ig-like domain-containing protein n=1 Tax=Vibrio scophthalmi TaxID=45658 RepID=UPI00349FCAAF
MGLGAYLSIANVAGAIVVSADGNVRNLKEGESPLPGDIIMLPDGTFTEAGTPVVNAAIAEQDGSLRDVSDDVQQIIAAVEEGQDPTQVDEEFDPAAGEENGSSGTSLDSVQRTGDEAIAQTLFETQGFESLGLSTTQSLGLIERIITLVNEPTLTPTPEPDTPPQARSFDVSLDESGRAAIIFNDDVDSTNDHISDAEDDAANAPLRVVITSLPESGVLFYDGVALTENDLTVFNNLSASDSLSQSNDDVIGELKTFDPTLFTYENDNQSTGFFLGVQEDPEGFEGDESTTAFLNWGEPVEGDPTQRVLTFEGSDDVIRITANSDNDQALTQYYGDKNHVGYGLGVGDGNGIQANESITIDMSDRPSDSVTLGLDGLGAFFHPDHPTDPSSVLITVYLDDGGPIIKEITKEITGDINLFKEIEIFAAEGQEGAQITSVELSTIGNGNWELRYFEANAADDSFDYRAVDSDDNVSEERTVSLVEADNAPPIATDDPVAFEVALGKFNGDDWSHPDAQISASYQGDDKGITESGVKRGVEGDENGGPGAQIQYNREEGESEQFRIDLDEPVTEFSFSVSNLFKNEGGSGNHEQGKWVAYLGDNAVASGLFIANEGNSNGTYSYDETALGGVAFDNIVFESVDFVNEPSRGSDSSDYFLTGFKASSDGAYAANQGDVLQIPVAELLGNDADPDGDNIRFTHVSDANNANIWIEDGIVYIDLDDDFIGNTHFDYVITDDKGGFDEAKVSIIVNPLPIPVEVDSIEMLDTTVVEGDNLVYQVALEDGVLEETRYSIEFGANGDTASDNDVDLSNVQFTNGVTYDTNTNEIVVPIGISNFSIVIPTLVDGIYEITEDYTLAIGGVTGEGNIENVDIPQVEVSADVDVSEGQEAVFTVSLSIPTEAPTTINLGINHVTTESDDISAMVVEFEGNSGWEALTVANNGDVILPAGVNEIRVTIPTVDDNNAPVYEGPESFELTAVGVVGAQGSDTGTATIFDDGSVDPQGPTPPDDDRPIVTAVSEPTVEEGGVATFEVDLSASSLTDTTITLTLSELSATTPEDFEGTELTVQFGATTQVLAVANDGTAQFVLPAGESAFDVLVQTTDDAISDNNEMFTLSAATEYQQGAEQGSATITDNEAPTLDLDGGQYQIEFVSENAGYQNVFGYYVYDDASDTQELMILIADSHDYQGNMVDPVLGQIDSLDNVGYFLIPDGADVINNAPDNAQFTMNDDGELLINGAVVPNQTVFSTHGENSTIRISEDNDGNTVLSFDDQLVHPNDDDDYDDLVIKVSKVDTNVDYQTTFTEGDSPVSIADIDADIFDDHDRISSMEVTLVNKLDGDTLVLPADTTGYTIGQSVLASSIVLTVTADDPNGLSAADFEAFLKQIGFENTSDNPDETDRTVTVQVTDNAGQTSNTATTTIKVIEVSDLDVIDSASGKEDTAIALDISLPADSSVVEVVIKDIPDGAVLASNGNAISVANGMASVSPSQLDTLEITPPEHSDVNFSLRVEGYTANDTVIEDHIIEVDVEAVTDTPTIDIEGAEILSFHNFDTIDLDGRSWRGDIDSQELTDANVVSGISDGAEGVWGTDNNKGNKDYHEVGKETVYRGNAGEQGNQVYELEGRHGDDQLYTQFDGEAGQFYALSFDVAARRLDDSPMTVFLEDSQGNRTILFEYTDQQSKQWSSETLNFQTPDDGQYKVVFESETSANSYGALLDDIKLETLDNIGYEDSYIALSDIVVGLVDTDGSESLTTHLDLSAFPSGTVVKAPNGDDLTPDSNGIIDITAWQSDLAELFINVPEPGNYPLVVTTTAQDNAPGVEESVDKVINVTVLPILDAVSQQIEIVEDTAHILSLNDFGITDPDTTLFITHLSSNGQYELQTSLGTWEPISERDRVDASEISFGNVRFVPAEHETGYDQYPNAGEGNQYQDYSSLGFILEKGDARSEEQTLTIDVSPVADDPTVSIVFGESTVNGQGEIETEVDITASVTDLDGSEQIQSVIIQGLPATAVVSAGYQDGVNWVLPVTGSVSETFDNLVITHPQGTVLDIDVTATSIEAANNDTATSTENAASQQDIYADQGGETPMTLMSLIIDSSGSMRSKPFYNDSGNPDQNKMRMELVLEASIEMLEHVNVQEGSENVLVQLIDFDDQLGDGKDGQANDNADRNAQSEGWMTVNQAISMLGSALSSVADSSYTGVFDPSGYTDYEEAVYGVMNGYDDAALNSVDLTNTNDVIFFLSDGSNNRGWDSTTNSEWDAFIVGKEVTSVGVGVPSSIPKEGLEEVAGSGNILYIPDSKIKTELPKLRPTIGLPGTLLAMITGMDVEEIVINASSVEVLQEIDVNGEINPASVTTRVDIDDLVIETDYGDLRIKEDGSYFFQPDPTAPQLGAGEAVGYNILYTVLDTNGVESQHLATLNISQSGDVKANSPSLNGSTGDDVITGSDADDVLLGHQGNDVIDGGLGDDYLFGGEGDDVLIGGLGNDVLTGGEGNDTFLWMNGDLDGGLDVIKDFTVNEDKIDISDLLGQNETMDDLFNSITATVVDSNHVELTISRDNGQNTQTIQLDSVVDQIDGINSGSGNITGNELTNLLNELIKPAEI